METPLHRWMESEKVRNEDLAATTGLSIGTIKNARAGERLTLYTASQLARATGLELADFVAHREVTG